jgi:hypothetical protein
VASCKAAVCGDGFVQEGVEACDEAVMNSSDPDASCNLDCQIPGMPPVMSSTTSTQPSRPRGTSSREMGGCNCRTSAHSGKSHNWPFEIILLGLLGVFLRRRGH